MRGSNPSADSGAETGPRAEHALGGFDVSNRDRHEAVNPGGLGQSFHSRCACFLSILGLLVLLGLFNSVTRDIEFENDAVMNEAVDRSRCRHWIFEYRFPLGERQVAADHMKEPPNFDCEVTSTLTLQGSCICRVT